MKLNNVAFKVDEDNDLYEITVNNFNIHTR